MHRVVLIVPGRLATRTGGYGYDRRLLAALGERGWRTLVCELDPSFPNPTRQALDAAAETLARIADGTTVLLDGLALGAMPLEAEREVGRLDLVALVHHPLGAEVGIAPEVAVRLVTQERRALAVVRRVIVTSHATASALESYAVPLDRITVAEPGTDPAPLARGSGGDAIQILSVGALIPRKGFDVLFGALGLLRELDWTLIVAGSLDRDPNTVATLRAMLHTHRLEDRVRLLGEASEAELAEQYDRADLFVLATRYEGYGMAVAEALARGLPVVSTPTGGIPSLLAGGAGLLVAPGDVDALAVALARVIGDRAVRQQLADGARRARARLPGWQTTADTVAAALERTPR